MIENFLELVDIESITFSDDYVNMVDITVDSDESFILSNGIISHNSANSGFVKNSNKETQGSFALRGKFVNVSEITNAKLSQNEEVINLMASLGLKLGMKPSRGDLRYGRIIISTDADVDGNSITGLLLNFFNKYWPDLFDMKFVYKSETPLLVANNKLTKKKEYFYNASEFEQWSKTADLSKYEIKYKKGLGALDEEEYKMIIENPKLTLITKDDLGDNSLEVWFGKLSELRKNELLKS